jgi:hypothetical protein
MSELDNIDNTGVNTVKHYFEFIKAYYSYNSATENTSRKLLKSLCLGDHSYFTKKILIPIVMDLVHAEPDQGLSEEVTFSTFAYNLHKRVELNVQSDDDMHVSTRFIPGKYFVWATTVLGVLIQGTAYDVNDVNNFAESDISTITGDLSED